MLETMAHLSRYREIARVLAKYGFEFLIDTLGPRGWLPPSWRGRGPRERAARALPKWERVRRALEELGPTFIKAGQILSTRPDIVPPELASELEKLQDEASPFPFHEVNALVCAELGAPPAEVFAAFEQEPVAAASVGQVHNAILKSGEEVVVKVQRPGVERAVSVDLEILREVAAIVGRRLALGKVYDLAHIVDELAHALSQELDYRVEAANAVRFAHDLGADPSIGVPRVFWEYTTGRVLTMERIRGTKLTELDRADSSGAPAVDRHAVARSLGNTILQQILVHGFFHADLHPGNVIVTPEGKVVLLDFGMVGEVGDDLKAEFGDFLVAVASRSSSRLVATLFRLGIVPPTVDERALARDVDLIQRKYYGMPLAQLSIADLTKDTFKVALKHRIRIRSDFALVMKALATVEGTVRKLDPALSLVAVAEPFAKRLLRERAAPRAILASLAEAASGLREAVSGLPHRLARVLDAAAEGRLKVRWELEESGGLWRRVDLLVNRVVLSIVLASIIVGTALALLAERQIVLWRLTLGEAGFVLAVGIGVWLLVLIIRSGRF